MNRKTILLLNSVIESGLNPEGEGHTSALLQLIPKEAVDELKEFGEEYLNKAGLTELSEKMKSLNTK